MPIAQLDRASVSGTDYSGSTPDRHKLKICKANFEFTAYSSNCINQPSTYLLYLRSPAVELVLRSLKHFG